MRRFFLLFCASCLLLTGCGWLGPCGNGDPLSLFQYCPKRPYFPHGARWVKEGMTRESRKADWVACGGKEDLEKGFRKWIPYQDTNEKYRAEEESHSKQLFACMEGNGYKFKPDWFSKPNWVHTKDYKDECTPQICLYP